MNGTRLSLREVAKSLNVHVSTVERWVNHGVRGRKLSSLLIGGRRFVTEEAISKFIVPHDEDVTTVVKSSHAMASKMLDALWQTGKLRQPLSDG